MLGLHDEVVGIGNLRGFDNLFVSGIINTKRDVVAERIVKQDGLLIHIANQLSEVVNAQILDVNTVNQYLTFLHIIIAGDEVHQCRFSTARLPHNGYGLALGNN